MKNQFYLLSLAALFAVPIIAQVVQPAPGAPTATEAVADLAATRFAP